MPTLRRPFLYILLAALCLWPWIGAAQSTPDKSPVITTPTVPALLPTATPTANAAQNVERTYTVQPADTLLSVAVEIGIDLADVPCLVSPTFHASRPLVIGDRLTVPDSDVLCHAVRADESIKVIAELYSADPVDIFNESWNQFSVNQSTLTTLTVGRYVRVPLPNDDCGVRDAECRRTMSLPIARQQPGAGDPFLPWMLDQPINTSLLDVLAQGGPAPSRALAALPADWPYGSGHFAWPLAGWLTQGYRYDHRAIDVAAPLGTQVLAADRGVVTRAGWNKQGYGLFVVIDHNIDYVTLYAHLSQLLVQQGDVVVQGNVVGLVGSTGNSTGPHLHFEIRDFGRLINPLELLGR